VVGIYADDGGMTKPANDDSPDNQVFLRGRLAEEPEYRELPSGDVLAAFRLTVRRPSSDRARVDSIECSAVKPRVHRTLNRLAAGDEIEVAGSLHRRFWRTPAGPASRYAVEVDTVRILSRAGRTTGASRGRTPASA
jgi:single-strand DNA-binding protein